MGKSFKGDKFYTQLRKLSLELPPGGFVLNSGKILKEVTVAYEVYGDLNAEKNNGVLICPPLTMDAHVAGWYTDEDKGPGWWDEMVGPNKAIDTQSFFVIGTNILGGCRGTTGPSSINPETGKPYGSSFPKITIGDIVHVQALLVEQLGVKSLAAVIGGSLGGMQVLEWGVSFSHRVRKCMCIAASSHLSPQALGFEVVGRKIVTNDPAFHEGDYYEKNEIPKTGLAYARMLGLLTYLSADSMDAKFKRVKKPEMLNGQFETGYDVENYLDYNANKFVDRFDANSYLHITYAMDTYDLAESHGSVENAFKNSQSEFLLVALSSDWLFPPSESRRLAGQLLSLGKIASLVELDSPYGHDAFLLEVEHLSPVIHSFLQDEIKDEITRTEKISTLSRDSLIPAEKDPVLFDFLKKSQLIEELIEPGSHVLDVGCGNGALIDSLYKTRGVTGFGIDIDLAHIIHCLFKNVPVIHGDVDNGLTLFGDQTFDYAVLNQTMQMLKKPKLVLSEMLRVAKKGIVVFPNFANINNRVALALKGVMPKTQDLPYNWWESPNIHLFTYKDFCVFCDEMGIKIEKVIPMADSALSKAMLNLGLSNLGAEMIMAKISKS